MIIPRLVVIQRKERLVTGKVLEVGILSLGWGPSLPSTGSGQCSRYRLWRPTLTVCQARLLPDFNFATIPGVRGAHGKSQAQRGEVSGPQPHKEDGTTQCVPSALCSPGPLHRILHSSAQPAPLVLFHLPLPCRPQAPPAPGQPLGPCRGSLSSAQPPFPTHL